MAKANIAERANTVTPEEYLGFITELVVAEREIDRTTTEAATAKSAASAAKGVKRGILKRAEKAGTDVDALKSVATLRAMDAHDRDRLLETTYLYAKWEGVEINVWRAGDEMEPQGGLFDNDPAAKEAQERFKDAVDFSNGRTAAKSGGLEDENPNAPGSPGFAAWMRGYKDFEAEAGFIPRSVNATASTARDEPDELDEPVDEPVDAPAPQVAAPRPRGRPRKVVVEDTIGEPAGTA